MLARVTARPPTSPLPARKSRNGLLAASLARKTGEAVKLARLLTQLLQPVYAMIQARIRSV